MNDFLLYLRLGFEHVLPLGYDHILFIVTLFFFNSKIKEVLLQCTVFTAAHSLSLGIAASGYWIPGSNYVEPLIALSIVFTAMGNLFQREIIGKRVILIFLFGLIHGLGFASALRMLGVPADSFYLCLISFNIGVELGQIMVLLLLWLLVAFWFADKEWYRRRIVEPISVMSAAIASYWTISRIFF